MESSTPPEERQLRSETRPLPKTNENLLLLVRGLVDLPLVTNITLSPTGVSITRHVLPGEPVIPASLASDALPDVEFVMKLLGERNGLEQLPFNPSRHPFHALLEASRMISARYMRPTHIIAPDEEALGAFLGLPEGASVKEVFGLSVIYTANASFAESLMMIGSTSALVTDAYMGVAIPLFLE